MLILVTMVKTKLLNVMMMMWLMELQCSDDELQCSEDDVDVDDVEKENLFSLRISDKDNILTL